MRRLVAYFDGACWPNPNGDAACGAFIECDGERIWEHAEYLGAKDTSNNVAEYAGLIAILRYLEKLENLAEIHIYGDSDLVIKQMSGLWKVRRKGIKLYLPYYDEAMRLLRVQKHLISFQWIPREQNTEADFLSTKPLRDRGLREPIYRNVNQELDAQFEDAIRNDPA